MFGLQTEDESVTEDKQIILDTKQVCSLWGENIGESERIRDKSEGGLFSLGLRSHSVKQLIH